MVNVRSKPLISEVITGDASWILAYNPVLKYQLSDWNTNMLSPKEKVVSYNISAGHFLTTFCVTPWVCSCRSYSDFCVFTSKLWSVGEMPFGRGSHNKGKLTGSSTMTLGLVTPASCSSSQCRPIFHLPSQPPCSANLTLCDFWPLDWRLCSKAFVLCLSGIPQEVFSSRGSTAEASVRACVCACMRAHVCVLTCTCSMRETRLGFIHILVTPNYTWVPEFLDPPRKILML